MSEMSMPQMSHAIDPSHMHAHGESARVLRRTKVGTPAGSYEVLQCDAFVFNNVLYKRKGRLLFWLTDDERKIPVRIRFHLPFWLGTVTMELIKEQTL